jgi:hypothetical protein
MAGFGCLPRAYAGRTVGYNVRKGQHYAQVFGSFQNRDDGASDKATDAGGARCVAIVIARTAEHSRMSGGRASA